MIRYYHQVRDEVSTLVTKRGRPLVLAIPYVWLLLFFLIPFLLVFKISFTESVIGIPPVSSVLEWAGDWTVRANINLQNYFSVFTDPLYRSTILTSLGISSLCTAVSLVMGYAMAYAMASAEPRWRLIFLMLLMLPFWTSFLIRVYAWVGLLSNYGIINSLLMWLGITKEPLPLLYNTVSTVIGIVYCYLPFMVLPIYVALEKIKDEYREAAADLGCRPSIVFWRVTVPLSMPGVIAGCILVFIPAIGEFVIPELLGGAESLMIGRVMWIEFFNNRDWPLACSLAVVMLLLFVVPIMTFQRYQLRAQAAREGADA